jgi:lysophospholipase L1-like esterase
MPAGTLRSTPTDPGARRNRRDRKGQLATFRIYMFGASTLFGLGARDAHTIPAYLGREIGEKTRCAVEVKNFGQVGYVTTQDVIALLRHLHRGDVPGLAIFYGGANEVYSAIGSGDAGIPQNEDNRRREFNILHPQQCRRRAMTDPEK